MTLSDLAKYSVTWSVVQSLCDSWAHWTNRLYWWYWKFRNTG